MAKDDKNFNIILTGVGGQGLITLSLLIAEAAFAFGYDAKTSELHGLSQRGGSIKVDVRFGDRVWSPLVAQGEADLVLSLESQEALNAAFFANKNTCFLINQYQTPTMGKMISEKEVGQRLKKITKKIYFSPASQICRQEFNSPLAAGVFLLGQALHKKALPLAKPSLEQAIKKIIPLKYRGMNLNALRLAERISDRNY